MTAALTIISATVSGIPRIRGSTRLKYGVPTQNAQEWHHGQPFHRSHSLCCILPTPNKALSAADLRSKVMERLEASIPSLGQPDPAPSVSR
jgi:hypothetical protein